MSVGERVFGQGNRFVRVIALAALCMGAIVATPAAASADTWFASPGGSETASCESGDPCRIDTALEVAGDGDVVQLAGGTYPAMSGGLVIEDEIELRGTVGDRPVIRTAADKHVRVTASADATLTDVTLEGTGALWLESGVVERVYVSSSIDEQVGSDAPAACSIQLNAHEAAVTIRDSVCWVNEIEGESTAAAMRINAPAFGSKVAATLRNVTALAAGAGGGAIEAATANRALLQIDAKNVVARALAAPDIRARLEGTEPGFSEIHFDLAGSNFGTVAADEGLVDVTSPEAEGNQSAAPQFVDAADGDFRPAQTSPTLDAGVEDALDGAVDIDGVARPQASCLGPKAKVATDIGAYERVGTSQCSPDPPPPPDPIEAFVPRFRILKLKLNKRKGTGSIRVEVPGPGTATISGSGIKFLRRTAPTAGSKVTIPIRPWAVTLVKLNKRGKVRVRIRVQFESAGGGVQRTSRAVQLKRARHRARRSA